MAKRVAPMVLVVDDDRAHRLMLATLMEEWGYRVKEADDGRTAVALIRMHPVDLILMDMRMGEMDGIEATRGIQEYNPAIPIIIVTAFSSIATAVKALKAGAFDYLTKPLDFDALRIVMERALQHTRVLEENAELRRQLAQLQIPDIVGSSPPIKRLLELIALVAPSEATVLISGESGTGKGMVARAIHALSARADKPLVQVNCAAIPESLIESELFGHEKGAFTGADRQRRGRFAMADGGTIFLDEIGELPAPMQAKLLRVLQEGDIQRIGSDVPLPVDVRALAATNRNLEKMIADGAFREDLYYRLNVMAIEVPPLRERVEDIPALMQHFSIRFAKKNHKMVKGVTPQAMDLLLRHPWPGNIRELENAIERAVILVPGEYISERELPPTIQRLAEDCGTRRERSPGQDLGAGDGTLKDIEKQTILQVLQETGGNKSEAARRLGITRRTLKLKLNRW
jgi:two-component system, NtrC family, response regulator HydG